MVDVQSIVTAGVGFGFFAMSFVLINPWLSSISTVVIFIITIAFALTRKKTGVS